MFWFNSNQVWPRQCNEFPSGVTSQISHLESLIGDTAQLTTWLMSPEWATAPPSPFLPWPLCFVPRPRVDNLETGLSRNQTWMMDGFTAQWPLSLSSGPKSMPAIRALRHCSPWYVHRGPYLWQEEVWVITKDKPRQNHAPHLVKHNLQCISF